MKFLSSVLLFYSNDYCTTFAAHSPLDYVLNGPVVNPQVDQS